MTTQQTEPETRIAHPSSFRDNAAFLFYQGGELYRTISEAYRLEYEFLHSSGLYAELMTRRWLVPHEKTDLIPPNGFFLVLRPEMLPLVTYPYEWSFSQLKQAALLTLDLCSLALRHGMTLRDASSFNVGWKEGRPIFIDLPSFRRVKPGEPWLAYRQFCSHFLAPLALMQYVDLSLQKLLINHVDGLPLDLTSKLLPRSTYLNFNILIHVHLHARAQKKYSQSDKKITVNVSDQTLNNLFQSLRLTVESLKLPKIVTEWGDYYSGTNYTEEQFSQKRKVVSEWIEQVRPSKVLDLGANDGTFSRIACAKADLVVSSDIDPIAVEKNFSYATKHSLTNLIPIIQDLTQPSPGIGWALKERLPLRDRLKPDLGLALALIHHLAISNNTPFEKIFDFFANLAPNWIIELPTKEDSQVQRLLQNREDIFTNFTLDGFEKAALQHFEILKRCPIDGSQRFLYLLHKRVHQ